MESAFLSIFAEAQITPEKLESDAGSEFKNTRGFFKAKKIYFKVKFGTNKARYNITLSS